MDFGGWGQEDFFSPVTFFPSPPQTLADPVFLDLVLDFLVQMLHDLGHVVVVLAQVRRVLDQAAFVLVRRILVGLDDVFVFLDRRRADFQRLGLVGRLLGLGAAAAAHLEGQVGLNRAAALGAGDGRAAHVVETAAAAVAGALLTPFRLGHVDSSLKLHIPTPVPHGRGGGGAFAMFATVCQNEKSRGPMPGGGGYGRSGARRDKVP